MAKIEGKKSLEAAVTKAAKAIGALIAVTRRNSAEITAQDVDKAIVYLTNVLNMTGAEARVVARAFAAFSLDQDVGRLAPNSIAELSLRGGELVRIADAVSTITLPNTTTLNTPEIVLPPAPTTEVRERRKLPEGVRLEGRLVGTKEPLFTTAEESKFVEKLDTTELPDPKHGGIREAGFIDD